GRGKRSVSAESRARKSRSQRRRVKSPPTRTISAECSWRRRDTTRRLSPPFVRRWPLSRSRFLSTTPLASSPSSRKRGARRNRLEEALPHSLRAIEIQATPLFLCGLGNIQVNSDDFAGAEVSFRKAIALQPENVRAHVGLGGVYLLQGDLLRGWPEYAYVRYS